MSILITGSNGLVGQKIVAQLLKKKVDFIATSKGENRNPNCPSANYQSLDITNKNEIENLCNNQCFSAIINTAAMTNVDACEVDPINCCLINVEGVKNLYEIAADNKAFLVHVSTDFVFDGEKGSYKEDDKRNPLSVYATSKRDSENLLFQGQYKDWAILRTIIVYGQGHNLSRSNIVLWAREALKSGKELTIVDDQFRAPTWASDLAWSCIKAADIKAEGVYHISGPETFSIFELVGRIADFYSYDKSVIKPIASSTLNQKAKRPPKTGFDISKAKRVLGYNPLTFEESLSRLED